MYNFTSGIEERVGKAYKAFLSKQKRKRIISKKHVCLCGKMYKISVAIPEKFSEEITDQNITVEPEVECEHSAGNTGIK